MVKNFHGVASLLLIFGAVVVGLIGLFDTSPLPAWIYGVGSVVGAVMMVFSYCAKCVCRATGCGHVFPGKLADFLPARKQGKYSFWDYLGVILPLGFILGFPQFWLWKTPLLWIFWMLITAAFAQILLFVCRGCGNANCSLQTARNRFSGCSSVCQ